MLDHVDLRIRARGRAVTSARSDTGRLGARQRPRFDPAILNADLDFAVDVTAPVHQALIALVPLIAVDAAVALGAIVDAIAVAITTLDAIVDPIAVLVM